MSDTSLIDFENEKHCYVLPSKGREFLEAHEKYSREKIHNEKRLNEIKGKKKFWKSCAQVNNLDFPLSIAKTKLRVEKMLINPGKRSSFFIIILLFIITIFLPLVQAEQIDAAATIASVKEQILICYQAVKEAEGAGANITALVAVLNHAGTLLSRAEFAYSISDFEIAHSLAVQSQSTLGDFVSDANTLKETATQQRNQDFLINVVGSLVGAFAVVGAGGVTWIFLKKKTLKME